MEGPSVAPPINDGEDEDSLLAKSEYLTRQEVIERRVRRMRRLAKCYRDYYWSLMEEVRRNHREFYWTYGKSPYLLEEDEGDERENGAVNGDNVDDNGNNESELGFGGSYSECSQLDCERKAMALTKYCLDHILLDSKQVLYKKCIYPHKRTHDGRNGNVLNGPLLCGKAILRSVDPPLCPDHALLTKKHITSALKKAGASPTLSSKLTSKFHFHLVIKEYVHLIQSRRRATASRNVDSNAVGNGSM